MPETSATPQMRLDFYAGAVILTRWADDGRVTAYPVNIYDVAAACGEVELGSGLLPARTLFWRKQGTATSLGIYVPARRWRVQTIDEIVDLPLPPLVFTGWGREYRVFAVKRRPRVGAGNGATGRLYHAPCPNVHASGVICSGNTPFPECAPDTIEAALQLFLEGSYFNGDLSAGKCRRYPDDVRQLWAELAGKKRFPLSELAPARLRLVDLL